MLDQTPLYFVQIFSIIIGAFGAPGLTFWVMKKMSREALYQIKENCKICRSNIDARLDNLDIDLHEVQERQLKLREKLPINYVRRDEFLRYADRKT